jgi:DnaK suppressor protein
MWMTREEIAESLGIVPNSVRGKVQKGQIERKIEDGKNLYRVVDPDAVVLGRKGKTSRRPPSMGHGMKVEQQKTEPRRAFDPKEVLLDELASLKVERSIDAIEKGDEIDLATGEISRELQARLSMLQQKQLKEIQDALERLKHGEYGICEECGEPIPEQRLRLFPAAKMCVRCQEEADHFEKIKTDLGMRSGNWREDASDGTYGKSFDE